MVPKVSVVMPVKNAGATLAPAVKSLLMQTMREFELIIVDDGGGMCRLKLSVLQDKRVKIITLPSTGIVGALNAGIAAASTPYIARMDADDVCSPRRLELQLAYMENNPDCALLGSRVRKFPRRALKDGMLHYERWLNSVISPEDINRDFFVESPFAHPSVMFRREDFLSLGGYRNMGWPEDYDLWFRFARAGKGMAKLNETLLFWRDTEDRLSRRSGVYSAEKFREVKAHFLKGWRLKGVSDVQVWGSGPDGKTWAKLLIKNGFQVLQFIDIDRKKVGGRACGPVDRPRTDQQRHPYTRSGSTVDRGIPVVWPGDIIKGVPVLCAVGIKGAREQIRDYLRLEGLREPEEFLFLS
jgi:Glycosyl transferase family 2